MMVEGGSSMKTGWSVPRPEDLDPYQDDDISIAMELWVIYRGKSDFPVTQQSIREWEDITMAFPCESEYWEADPPSGCLWREGQRENYYML